MEWKCILNTFSDVFKSLTKLTGVSQHSFVNDKSCKMGPKEPVKSDSEKSWFSGQKLLGQVISLTSSVCGGLTQTGSVFTGQGSKAAPSFYRLNSQGESEEEFLSFPSVSPSQEGNMAETYGANNLGRGWGRHQTYGYKPVPSGVKYDTVDMYRQSQPPSCSRGMGQFHWSRLPSAIQQQYWQPQPAPFLRLPYQPYCAYSQPCAVPTPMFNYGQQYQQPQLFQFRGHSTNGFRHSAPRQRSHTGYRHSHSPHKRVKPQGARQNLSSPGTEVGNEHALLQELHNSGCSDDKDVARKMQTLSISSDKCDETLVKCSDSQIGTDSSPSPVSALLDLCQEHVSGDDISVEDHVNTEISLVTDLFSSPVTEISRQHTPVSTPPGDTASQNCDDQKTRPDVKSACFVLTPKTYCITGNKKKKSRPSSKKRHRRKLQTGAENQAFNVPKANANKKRHTQSSHSTDSKIKCSSEPLFVIDFSESEYSETEPQCSSPPKVCGSPITAKFSLVFSATDFSDSEDVTTDSDESWDSDFFDDDIPAKTRSSDGPKWQSMFSDVNCLSPFTFKITCITSPAASSLDPPEDEVDGEELSEEELAVIRNVEEANKKWQHSYEKIPASVKSPKVHFPVEESSLQTVFTLQGEEVEDYRQARLGQWEEFARDRQRFQNRIHETEKSIGHCLHPDHRERVYRTLIAQ